MEAVVWKGKGAQRHRVVEQVSGSGLGSVRDDLVLVGCVGPERSRLHPSLNVACVIFAQRLQEFVQPP